MKSNWRGLKVLPLKPWMLSPLTNDILESYIKTRPYLNRNGLYYYKGICWFEIGTRAYFYSSKQFKDDLELVSAISYSDKVYRGLLILEAEKLLTKRQTNDLRIFERFKNNNTNIRNNWLHRLKFLKGMKNRLANMNGIMNSIHNKIEVSNT